MTRVILLMGAPTTQTLQWDESELLDTPVAPFYGPGEQPHEPWPFPEEYSVKWRVLGDQMDEDAKPTSQTNSATFFNTEGLAETKGEEEEESVLSQFYDHSFAVHEISQVSDHGLWTDSTDSTDRTTSSNATSNSRPDNSLSQVVLPPMNGSVTALHDIPSTGDLRSIAPQTMTVNLIVGIITIQRPRRVVTRQWKRELDIVEMVVGDETRTGFGVTCWLPSSSSSSPPRLGSADSTGLRQSLASLRPQDIALLRNVGLSSFQERVYGQSLRNGITKVDLLHRKQVGAFDPSGVYGVLHLNATRDAVENTDPVVDKVQQVREWIRRFVADPTMPEAAGGGGSPRMRAMKRGQTLLLPPDTQDEEDEERKKRKKIG